MDKAELAAVPQVHGDAAAEGVDVGRLAGEMRAGEAEAEEAAADVEEGVGRGGRVGDEEERRLGGEVGRGHRERGAAEGAEGEELLEARQAPRDLAEQVRW